MMSLSLTQFAIAFNDLQYNLSTDTYSRAIQFRGVLIQGFQ
jgi:hypothetical protein